MCRRQTGVILVMTMLTLSTVASTEQHLREATLRKTPTGHEIAFTLAKPTDVTVRIVDAKGNVVRHLACGMVGLEKAAAPFAPKTLSQNITWDGKDHAGNPVELNGSKVWVGTGIKAKFDRFILWEKNACARATGNYYHTVDTGETYVIQKTGVHLDTLRLFDANGKFVRQVWPPSLDRSTEAVQSLLQGRWGAADWDGDGVPIKVCMNSWYLFGTRSNSLAVTTDGYVVGSFTGVGRGFYAIDPNGFPHAWGWRPPWFVRKQRYKTKKRLCAGRDGDFYYTDSYHHVVGRFRARNMSPIESFTHNGSVKLDKPTYYLGEMDKAGDDEAHFRGPDDVAVDKDGNICVLDGNKVKRYSQTGAFIREAGKDSFPAARPVPEAVRNAEKTPRALSFPRFLDVRDDGKLFVMNFGKNTGRVVESDVDGKTFKTFKQPWARNPYHGYSAFDDEGNWYVAMSVRKQPQQIWKYDRDGKRAKFGDKDAILLGQGNDLFNLNKGLFVATNGDVYVVTQKNKWTTKSPVQTGGVVFGDLSARGEAACQTRVDVYRADGTLKKKGIVKSVGINDVAVDREGNIYIIDGTMWHGAQMAQVAAARGRRGKYWPFDYLTPEQAALDPKTQANKRYSLLSRLVKFSPKGGILDDKEGRGQLWNYAGVSGVSPWNCDAECPASQICLDPDERFWVPDSFLYCVKAVDTAGNEMIRVGKYGNEDCTGGGGDKRHPKLKHVVIDPEIPLAYPKGIAVYKDYLLISDMYAHRVVRCRLEYKDRREIPLKP